MRLKICKGIQADTIQLAVSQIELVNNKTIKPKKLKMKGLNYFSLRVGLRHRVIIKRIENGIVCNAILCTHENYTKLIQR